MTAFLYRMDAGVPGALTRGEDLCKTETNLFNSSLPFSAYGLPGKIASGKFVPFAGGEAGTDMYGFLVRPYPTQSTPAVSSAIGSVAPGVDQPAVVLKSGYISAVLNNSTDAAKNGTVYIRIAVGTGSIIGGVEAAADGVNTIVMPNAYFTGPKDANGNVEIAYNL